MTGHPVADPLELLLPDAILPDLDIAERLTRALRILSSDAGDSGSPSVHVQLDSARDELSLYHSGTVGSLLQDLLIHVALEAMTAETYLMLPVPRRTYAAAWSQAFVTTSEEERRTLGLRVPAASTAPLAVLGELVEALEAHEQPSREGGSDGTGEVAAQLWRLRFERLSADAEGRTYEGEGGLEALLGKLSRMRGPRVRALRLAVLGDLVALHLDRSHVLAASEAIRRAGPTALRPADCQGPMDLLVLMVGWLVGEGDLPDLALATERCTALGAMPPGWQQLALLSSSKRTPGEDGEPQAMGGTRHRSAAPAAARLTGRIDRKGLGATALVVSSIEPNGTLKIVHAEIAPGLASQSARWTQIHRGALAERGTPEHEVGCRAEPLLLVRGTDFPGDAARISASCIARRGRLNPDLPDEPVATAVQPILDGDGEPAGLVWMEYPTRLVPSGGVREAVAQAMGQKYLFHHQEGACALGPNEGGVLARRTPIQWEARVSAPGEAAGAAARARAASADVGRAWESVLGALQLKTAERRWIAFHVEEGGEKIQWVATGGDAGERLGRATDEGTWAIRRSLRTGGAVRYGGDGADAAMLHPGALSGAALPLHRGGRVIAVLSLESARRGDARQVDVDRWFETLQLAGPAVEAAMLSAADRRQFDGGFGFDADEPDFEATFQELCGLRRSPADVLVTGEVGVGRRTWTRLMHSGDMQALAVRSAFSLEAEEILDLGQRDGVATLAISDLEWLSPPAQAALLKVCSTPIGQRPRVLATLRVTQATGQAAEATPQGGPAVHSELLRRLSRVVVRRPALRHRRHQIVPATKFLLGRIAHMEGWEPPVVEDAAMAHLWRQPWVENLSGLEAVLYSGVMNAGRACGAGAASLLPALGASEMEAAVLDAGLEAVPRMPSRAPSAVDLAAALWTTRTATGRINKTRAALYLGWDPNTLSQRLKEGELRTLDQASALLGAGSRVGGG